MAILPDPEPIAWYGGVGTVAPLGLTCSLAAALAVPAITTTGN
jgi:hypothetical protein